MSILIKKNIRKININGKSKIEFDMLKKNNNKITEVSGNINNLGKLKIKKFKEFPLKKRKIFTLNINQIKDIIGKDKEYKEHIKNKKTSKKEETKKKVIKKEDSIKKKETKKKVTKKEDLNKKEETKKKVTKKEDLNKKEETKKKVIKKEATKKENLNKKEETKKKTTKKNKKKDIKNNKLNLEK